jgi:hypothetical protein
MSEEQIVTKQPTPNQIFIFPLINQQVQATLAWVMKLQQSLDSGEHPIFDSIKDFFRIGAEPSLNWPAFIAFIEQQYTVATLQQLKDFYTAITGQQYEGTNSKLAVARKIVQFYVPELDLGCSYDEAMNALVLFGSYSAEWGVGCNCGRHIRMKPNVDLSGWVPVNFEDLPGYHGAGAYSCPSCRRDIILQEG